MGSLEASLLLSCPEIQVAFFADVGDLKSTLEDEGLAGLSVGAGGRFPDGVMLSLTGVLNNESVSLLPLHLFILVK